MCFCQIAEILVSIQTHIRSIWLKCQIAEISNQFVSRQSPVRSSMCQLLNIQLTNFWTDGCEVRFKYAAHAAQNILVHVREQSRMKYQMVAFSVCTVQFKDALMTHSLI